MKLNMNTAAANEKMLFDFRTARAAEGWQIVNDDVMGGVSTSRFEHYRAGCVVFSGVISLANSGGFASVRSLPAQHHLGETNAFMTRICGDGRRYKFTARTAPEFDSPLYQHVFTTTAGAWKEILLRCDQFEPTFRGRVLTDAPPLDQAKLVSVGFLISNQQAGSFRLEIEWIRSLCLK
jgi:Complex I intermediate-associated protein 30 (CIA30)